MFLFYGYAGYFENDPLLKDNSQKKYTKQLGSPYKPVVVIKINELH
jgi:hypothetical protein